MSLEESEEKLVVGESQGELTWTPNALRDKRIELLEQRMARLEGALRLNPLTGISMFIANLKKGGDEE